MGEYDVVERISYILNRPYPFLADSLCTPEGRTVIIDIGPTWLHPLDPVSSNPFTSEDPACCDKFIVAWHGAA